MPRPDPLLTQLQREIADLRAQVKTLQSAPRLRHASIDDASVPIKGPDGRVKAVLGKQADGSHGDKVIESGPQPTPTPPILDPGAGALSVEWDGGVVEGDVSQIFGRVEVLAAPIPEGTEPDPTDARHLSSVYSAEGGATTIKATSGDWAVWLRMVGADGKTYSELSEPTTVTLDPTVDELTLRERIEAALTGELEDGLYDSLAGRIAQFIELEAESIRAYHLAFDALDGQIITGALVQSSLHPQRGAKMTDEGFVAYDEEGRVTVWIDGEQVRLTAPSTLIEGDIQARSLRLLGDLTVGSSGEGRLLPAPGGRLRIEGRVPDDAGPRDTFTAGTTPYISADEVGDFRVSVTYAAPASTGTRTPVVTANFPNSATDTQRRALVQFTTMGRTASGFDIQGRGTNQGGASQVPRISFSYLATWGASL